MNRQLASRNAMVDWQVAPPEFMINTYDQPKIDYRRYVENMLKGLSTRSLKKKTFVTISTNVLCAEVRTSGPNVDPIDRDIYQPLEIALSKWSTGDYSKPHEERCIKTITWIIDPGDPTDVTGAMDHARNEKDPRNSHKIDYKKFSPSDTYIEKDIHKIVSDINAFLTSERTVFSRSLAHCRQDLGCLKWLNRETGYNLKPIKVYSAEDLYVVLLRRFAPDGFPKEAICQGIARHQFECGPILYETNDQCEYHQDRVKEDDSNECGCCAKAISVAWAHVIMDSLSQLLELIFAATEEEPDISGALVQLRIDDR